MTFTLISGPYGNCPVQAFGTIGEHHWYFRARGDCILVIGPPDGEIPEYVSDFGAVWGERVDYEATTGRYPGWMEDDEARGVLAGLMMLYLSGHPGSLVVTP